MDNRPSGPVLPWHDAVAAYTHMRQWEARCSPHTLASQASDFGQFTRYLTDQRLPVSLTSLTLPIVRGYLAALAQAGRKPKTIKHHLTTLKGFARYLDREAIWPDTWTVHLKGPRIVERRADPLSEAEVQQLLHVIPRYTAIGQRDHCLLRLFLLSGLRIGEMLALTVGDCRLADRVLIVRHGKNDKDRVVPLTDSMAAELAHYIEQVRPAFVHPASPDQLFLSRIGRPLQATSTRDRVRYYAQGAGLTARRIHPHKFRATFATRLDQTGTNVTVIQELMGHAHIETTSRYVGIAPQQMREAVQRLPTLE